MGSPFLHFALGCSHLPENSILFINRPFSARFSNCCNSLNFEAKINFNTTRQNDLKWRKTCIGLKFDLEHFYGPQTKFIRDSLYKHPVDTQSKYSNFSFLFTCESSWKYLPSLPQSSVRCQTARNPTTGVSTLQSYTEHPLHDLHV